MVETARSQIEKTEQILQLTSTPADKTDLVRIKDSFVFLQQLANKQNPSVADAEKASDHAALIESQTSRILKNATQQAVEAVRQQIHVKEQEAQQKMNSIKKIYQRLYSVDLVERAHETAFSAMNNLQQIVINADKLSDLEKLSEAYQKAQQTLEVVNEQYNSIAKFDLDSQLQQDEAEEPSEVIFGSIRRD